MDHYSGIMEVTGMDSVGVTICTKLQSITTDKWAIEMSVY